MRYGIYYRGSKNEIANEIISFLPKAEYFVDVFGGGGAITHAASLSNKYKHIIYNDIDAATVQLLQDAVNGKYDSETRWISPEEFFNKRKEDGYIKLCWSFGNNGRGYIYGSKV